MVSVDPEGRYDCPTSNAGVNLGGVPCWTILRATRPLRSSRAPSDAAYRPTVTFNRVSEAIWIFVSNPVLQRSEERGSPACFTLAFAPGKDRDTSNSIETSDAAAKKTGRPALREVSRRRWTNVGGATRLTDGVAGVPRCQSQREPRPTRRVVGRGRGAAVF